MVAENDSDPVDLELDSACSEFFWDTESGPPSDDESDASSEISRETVSTFIFSETHSVENTLVKTQIHLHTLVPLETPDPIKVHRPSLPTAPVVCDLPSQLLKSAAEQGETLPETVRRLTKAHEDCARCASFCAESEIIRRVRMINANPEDKSGEMALVCNTPGALVPQGPSHMERDEDQEPLTIQSSTARFSQRVIETEITHTDERGEDQPTSSEVREAVSKHDRAFGEVHVQMQRQQGQFRQMEDYCRDEGSKLSRLNNQV